jgi:adenylate kinase
MNRPDLILLGPQGSGKTTQAELLSRNFGFALIGAGNVLREIAGGNTESAERVHRTIYVEGHLIDPELISDLMKEKIIVVPKHCRLILDGYPRTLTQYELFKKFWPETGRGDYRAISIDISREEAMTRLARRVTCGKCGAVFSEGTTEKCTNCGGRLSKRPDDTPEAIQNRLQSFYSETMPMIRTMETDGKVLHLDGMRTVDQLHQDIVRRLLGWEANT